MDGEDQSVCGMRKILVALAYRPDILEAEKDDGRGSLAYKGLGIVTRKSLYIVSLLSFL